MTEAAGITVSNFIAGAIALGLALMIIPGIVKSSIGGATGAVNKKDTQTLFSKINEVCNKDAGTSIEGEMSLGSQYRVEIDDDEFDVLKDGDSMEGWPKDLNCNYESGDTTLEGTRAYKIEKNDDGNFEFTG